MFKTRFISMLVLLMTAVTGAWADEQNESFTTASNQTTYTGEHFTITGQKADGDGLWIVDYDYEWAEQTDRSVTISSNNGENITRIEAVIGYTQDWDDNDNVVSTSGDVTGTFSDGETFTISSVNATTVTLSSAQSSNHLIQVKSWTIYYAAAPETTVSADFEDGNMPAGWDASHANNTWYVATEDYYGYAPAYSGTYSLYVDGNGKYDSDYFVSPALVFDGSAASLSFAYATPAWEGDHNDLSVCYGTSPNGPWNYTSFVWMNSSSWTTATVDLSSLNGTYYIAFESYDSYGYCTAIDNINITGAAPAASTTYTVTLKEGTDDATNWTITPAEATTTGVAAGTEVKATYGGTKKVKSVKAVKKAKPAATVTTAPTAKTGVKAGEDVAIVNEGAAEGGTMMYMVNATQPASTDGFSATVPTAEGLTAGTYYVWYYVKADDSHTDSEISASGIEVTIAAAETIVTWTSSDMPSDFYAYFDGWTNNNTHQGITVTASGDAQGGWSWNGIDVNEGSGTITFTSSVGNIKSIVITANSMNDIDEGSAPSGWTANEMWDNPRTLSWSGTASASVNLPLSEMQNFSNISTIVFTLE